MKRFLFIISLLFSLNIFAASEKFLIQGFDRISISNLCQEPIKVYVVYRRIDDTWDSEPNIYRLAPGQTKYVGNTRNPYYYFSGSSDSGKYVWKGESPITLDDGTKLSMIERRITSGDWGEWKEEFNCN